MATYADRTKTPIHQTINDIAAVLGKHGCEQFTYGFGEDRAAVAFHRDGRQVRFYIPMVGEPEQRRMSLMRALFLVIKARLEGAEAGIETFEEAFMAQITLPDGRRVGDIVKADLALAHGCGASPPHLLPDYR